MLASRCSCGGSGRPRAAGGQVFGVCAAAAGTKRWAGGECGGQQSGSGRGSWQQAVTFGARRVAGRGVCEAQSKSSRRSCSPPAPNCLHLLMMSPDARCPWHARAASTCFFFFAQHSHTCTRQEQVNGRYSAHRRHLSIHLSLSRCLHHAVMSLASCCLPTSNHVAHSRRDRNNVYANNVHLYDITEAKVPAEPSDKDSRQTTIAKAVATQLRARFFFLQLCGLQRMQRFAILTSATQLS